MPGWDVHRNTGVLFGDSERCVKKKKKTIDILIFVTKRYDNWTCLGGALFVDSSSKKVTLQYWSSVTPRMYLVPSIFGESLDRVVAFAIYDCSECLLGCDCQITIEYQDSLRQE